jgi:hypothetical protein
MGMATIDVKPREPKDLRYRRQFFPDAEKLVFETKHKGFVPLPIMLRKLLPHISSPELRVLVYLHLRASRFGICYPTLDEIVHELGLTSRKNLTPHLESLEEKRFISTHTAAGKTFFLIHDPRIPIEYLAGQGSLSKQQLFEIDELYKDLGQPTLSLGRLQFGTFGSSLQIAPGNALSVHTVSVRNIERRFENTCHNLRAELRFVYPHTGDEMKVTGFFVSTDSNSVKGEPQPSISLGMLQSAQLAVIVRDQDNPGFSTFTTWPFDSQKEKRLSFGEWRLSVKITCDVERDTATVDYLVQLNPDLSSGWSPAKQTPQTF